MSHFTHMKTSFRNLSYLEKALFKLNIISKQQKNIISNLNSENSNLGLVIPQSNGYDIRFDWNGEEYDLVVDMSFWEQACPVESFIDKVAQQYAGEVIIGESQKTGFQPVKYQQNSDGSTTLILERWNNTKILQTV